MTENTPIITITCVRDLALLDLQAQSIFNFLDHSCPVYLVVNEAEPSAWLEYFNTHLRKYYVNHSLKILFRASFGNEWNQWIPSPVNPWAVGWETQQILKLAIAQHLDSNAYLILDSQNFLIQGWSPDQYELAENKIPCRTGHYVMPNGIWEQYSASLGANVAPNLDTMTAFPATPVFLHTGLVQSLIDLNGGIEKFTTWFKNASRVKSEFILYAVWVEHLGGLKRVHQCVEDWANPYLRDSGTFAEDFEKFIDFIGVHKPHAWISVNHRSWGDMTDEQYQRLTVRLSEYNLVPHFDEYRSTYVDIKI